MSARIQTFLGIVAAVAALLLASCANDYDPFTDLSRARAEVTHVSFANGDTLNIFTTETLVVSIAVPELVDSFSVVAPGNRRSSDTFTVRKNPGERMSWGPYTCLVSFTDTGRNTLTVNTYRRNGERVPQDFFLFLRSPLHQNPLSGSYGDSIDLATSPVSDADVIYHWDFGAGMTVSSPTARTRAVVKMVAFSSSGSLWVSDASGAHPSPKAPFAYHLMDTTGPLIRCESKGYEGKDTIVTGDTVFYFKVQIWDPNQGMDVQSESINGAKFDIDDPPYYVKVFTRMDTMARLHAVTVTAVNNPLFLVSSQKTFWLRFSDSMSHGREVLFTVSDPGSDTSVSPARTKGILGYVEDYANDSFSVVVKMSLNNASYSQTETVRGTHKALWTFTASLASGSNTVGLAVFDSASGDSLAGQSLLIVYDATVKDTVPPVILEVTSNGAQVKPGIVNYDTTDTAHLRIIAYDEGSGLDSLLVNGKAPVLSPDGHGFIWLDTVPIVHQIGGTAFTITAIDKSKNRDSLVFALCENRVPQIVQAPPASQNILLGATFTARIAWVDPDNDPVSVHGIEGPPGLTVGNDGWISWTPRLADVGVKTVSVSLDDGFQAVGSSFQLFVIGNTTLPPAVQIDTAAMHVPAYCEVGLDSVPLTIKTINDSGNTPLSFGVSVKGAALVVSGRQSVWRPGVADTGKQILTVSVTDTFHRSASANFTVTVEPPNRPCSLAVKYSIPVDSAGELDLTKATQPDTLFFSVKDPDIAAVEHHTVVIRDAAGQTDFAVDSTGKFDVILPPKPANGEDVDKMLVVVTDRAGHSDSLRFSIVYVSPGFSGKVYINTDVGGAVTSSILTGFPLLVRLDTSFFTVENFTAAGTRGQGIRFASAAGTALPYQIEQWDNLSHTAAIWVKVDTILPHNSSQYIVMTWNNSLAADNSNGPAVFPTASGYMGVWHMNDGSTTQNANSVQSQNPATVVQQGANSAILPCNGAIGGADSLANQNYLSVGQLPSMQQVSVSAWVNPATLRSFSKIITKEWTTYMVPYQVFSLELDATGDSLIQFHVGLSPQLTGYAKSTDVLQANTWTHLAGTYDGTTIRLYINGADVANYAWQTQNVPGRSRQSEPLDHRRLGS